MKKYFLSLALILSVTFNLGIAHASVVPVQTNLGSNDGSTNTVSASWGNPSASGDLLVAIIGFKGGSSINITPPSSLGWTLAVRSDDTDVSTAIYYIPNAPSQSASTWTLSSATDATLILAEYAGADKVSPLDRTSWTNNTMSNNPILGSSGSTSFTAYPNEVAVAGITTASGNTTFSGENNGFSEQGEVASILSAMAPGINTVFEDKYLFSTGSFNVQSNINGTYTTPTWAWAGAIATFKAEDTAGGATDEEEDFCVNIVGDQMTVPNGYIMDAAGNCIEEDAGGATGNDSTDDTEDAGDASDDTGSGSGSVLAPGISARVGFEEDVKSSFDKSENKFPDTDLNNICGKAAAELSRRSVINGFPDGTFKNGELVNRAQAAKFLILSRIGNIENWNGSDTIQFSDVLKDEWYTRFVMQSAQLGVINGYADLTFKPANPVNKAEFLKMLTLTFQLETGLPYNYTDVKSDDWFAKYAGIVHKYDLFPSDVKACSGVGVTASDINADGVPELLNPGEELSRADVAVAIYQYLKNRGPQQGSGSTTQSSCIQNHNCVPFLVFKHANPESHQVFTFNANFFGSPFSFNLDDDDSLSNPSSLPHWLIFPVSPGSYTISEVPVPGYTTDITYISNALFTTYLGSTSVNVSVAPNDHTSFVSFENTRTKGTLKVIKKVLPGNDPTPFTFHLGSSGSVATGYPATFQLDDNTNATLSNTATFSLDNSGSANGGAYWTLLEYAVPGYTTTVTCVDASGGSWTVVPPYTTAANAYIDISGSETVTCTFTNTKKKVLPTTATLLEGPLGAFKVPEEWGVQDSSGEVGPIDEQPCALVDSNCGQLIIIKDTAPDSNQGFTFHTNFSSDFTLDDDGGVATPFTTISNKKTFDLPVGTYTVNELGTSGYATSSISCVNHLGNPVKDTTTDYITGSAQIALPANETVTCTFVNEPVPTPAACFEYMPNVTACGVGVQINRTEGANTYKVKVSPSALTPTVNTSPSSNLECVTAPGSALQTSCAYYYGAYPTALTFTATSSAGALPAGAMWSGGTCSGPASTPCSATIYQGVPIYVIVTIP